MSIQLSRRLKKLADYVPEGASFVDVGTDHAYIPIYLAAKANTKSLIATDVAKGPIESAKQNVDQYHLQNRISIRFGDGLSPVQPGEVDTVLIAGMGGHTAVEILTGSREVVDHAQTLILQPMNASHLVRRFLDASCFYLREESVIEEDGRFYEIIVANHVQANGEEKMPSDPAYKAFRTDKIHLDFAYEFGPLLLNKPTRPFIAMMRHTRDKWLNLKANIARSDSSKAFNRKMALSVQIQIANEWLKKAEERLADE